MLSVKLGVHFSSIEMAMLIGTMVVEQVLTTYGVDCVITCGVEDHEWPSKHLYGALDFRSSDISSEKLKLQVVALVKKRLSYWFTFLYEPTSGDKTEHFHLQYPPLGKGL